VRKRLVEFFLDANNIIDGFRSKANTDIYFNIGFEKQRFIFQSQKYKIATEQGGKKDHTKKKAE
jgi:hypothetical protein